MPWPERWAFGLAVLHSLFWLLVLSTNGPISPAESDALWQVGFWTLVVLEVMFRTLALMVGGRR